MDAQLLADIEALLGREQRDTLLRLAIIHAERSLHVMEDDPPHARAEAHGLRGAVAPFGAATLVAMLRRIEVGEAVPSDELRTEVEQFVTACRSALNA